MKPLLPRLRLLISAGATLQPEVLQIFLKKRLIRKSCNCTVLQETCVVAVNYKNTGGTDASMGVPLQGFEIDILNESYFPMTNGEIAIRASPLTTQYDGLREMTAERFVNGHFLPGDLGCRMMVEISISKGVKTSD